MTTNSSPSAPPPGVSQLDAKLRRSKLLRLLDDFHEAKTGYLKKPTAKAQSELRFAVENIERNFDPAVAIPPETQESRTTLLRDCRDAMHVAINGDDGLDPSDALPLIGRIGEALNDGEDYNASLKCSDDPCEQCGGDGIRHVRKLGYASYLGLCDRCHSASTPPGTDGRQG